MISIGKTNQIEEPVKYHTVYSINSIQLRIITYGYLKFLRLHLTKRILKINTRENRFDIITFT